MKKGIIVGFILVTILISTEGCGSKSNNSGATENTETHTCATCGSTFSGSGYTDVFGERVCSTSCTGR